MTNDESSLKEFLCAYFHEDWIVDAASTDEVVEQYFRDQPRLEELAHIARALDGLLANEASDELLSAKLFKEFGCYFDPLGVGQSTRLWLESLAQRIRERARQGGEV